MIALASRLGTTPLEAPLEGFRVYDGPEWVGTVWNSVHGWQWARIRLTPDGGHVGGDCESPLAGWVALYERLRAEAPAP